MISSFPLLIREKNLEFLLFINQKELFKGTVSRDFRPFLVKKNSLHLMNCKQVLRTFSFWKSYDDSIYLLLKTIFQ